MSVPTGAVFLSYASQDVEAAKRICDALRAAGIEVWFDQSELRGGDQWDRKIREQIHDCRLFIPIISANSERRDEGYFRREWSLAADRTRDMGHKRAFLVPVVIDGTPERGASVPEKFHELQWTRLPGGDTPPAFVDRIQRLLSPEGLPATALGPPLTPSSKVQNTRASGRTPGRFKPALWVISTVVGLALAYFVADRLWLSKRTAAANSAAPPTATASEKSIAVLPFVDLSEKHDQEYFADGMAEETLNQLANVPGLKVIGRTSSFQFKGKADDLRRIGTTLGASYVLEGSVRRSGDRLRVTAQLIDTRDGTHRWSESYDRSASDVLAVQDEMAAGMARALQLEVATEARRLPRSPEAYDAYLRGLHARERYDQAGFEKAVADFRQALQLDPDFVPAGEALARALADQAEWYFVPPRIGFEQAREAAKAVLQRDSRSARAHAILANVHDWYDWDWQGAERERSIALSLAPHDSLVLLFASEGYTAVGRWTDAVRVLLEALAVDPLQASAYEHAGWAYLRLGRLTEAEAAHRRTLDISPTYAGGHYDLGIPLLLQGKTDAALTEMEQEQGLLGWRAAGLALVYQAQQRVRDADAELMKLEAEHAGDMAMKIAEVRASRGQNDIALTWLERAYAQKDIFLWSIKSNPLLRNLEGDPRYQAFLRKMNLPP
jgi:TolB-like protein/Tfp pilus assembly protein PilF